jgi:hypothetical protein
MLADIGLCVVRTSYSGPGPYPGAVSFSCYCFDLFVLGGLQNPAGRRSHFEGTKSPDLTFFDRLERAVWSEKLSTMPRRRRLRLPPRIALPGSELESKIMAPLRTLKECAKLKGVRFVHVGSFGQEPNWFAHPLPTRISEACRRAFVAALARVRKEFDLLFPSSHL